MRPYFDDGTVTIYHGDAAEVTAGLNPEVACIVTSPPYNVGIAYDDHDDSMPWDAYWRFAHQAAMAMWRASIDGARLWLNTGVGVPLDGKGQTGWHSKSTHKRRVLLNLRWAQAVNEAGFDLIDQIAWTSQRGSGTAWGSYESPASPNLRGDWEAITLACKGQWPRETPAEHKGWKDRVGNWAPMTSTVWGIAPENDRDGHPVPFPIEIPARCIRLSTWPGELVLDPFMGSGTTLDAARLLGRRAVGIEKSERYCERAAQRLSQGALEFPAA